ncbi:uncharacterized protein [Oryza sativa Japonica Group]|uniref:uncharacterized protein isoform X1 n=2 Tax=Oryza sativa subsp. japonica TaxID=39947 RepID=UPI000E1B6D3C|nr:uncharacterized protein LOC9271190 isoform X1 [Oryza sativa Japonica Group]XP_052141532.1 uncharacterized protein LOC127761299 isoform X2 [Oryza glaberrima]
MPLACCWCLHLPNSRSISSDLQPCHAESGPIYSHAMRNQGAVALLVWRCTGKMEMVQDIDITTTWTGKSYEASCCWCKWTCNQIKCPVMRRKRWPGQPRSRPMCLQSAAKWKLEQPDVSESMHCLNHELASPSLIRSLPST